MLYQVEGGSRAAAPKGTMTYAFTIGEISPSPPSSPWAEIMDLRLGFGPQDYHLALGAGFLVSGLDFIFELRI